LSRLRPSIIIVAVCSLTVLSFSVSGHDGLLVGVRSGEASKVSALGSVPGDAAPPARRRSLAPAKGALLGALIEQRAGIFWSKPLQLQFERTIGRKLAINHVFYWTTSEPRFQCSGEWPSAAREGWNYKRGTISMISWTPEIEGDDAWLDNFASGQDDQCFRRMAKALKRLKIPVLLRFMHEMNGNWYPWSGQANGGGKIGERKYREAWIHVWRIFQQEGATNVRWVWCPDSGDTPGDGSQHWTGYYPGDKYVDWVCVDGYNWNVPQWGPWVELSQILGERWSGSTVYADYARRKPFMIGETGSDEDSGVPGRKGKWFLDARNVLKTKYPLVKAFVYFSTIADDKDWRIQTSASSLAGFRSLARDPYFRQAARRP
jgi:Glycosyl hydrolase family 26